MGTTKLTRKEILAEDPVHEAIVQLVEGLRVHGKKIALGIFAAAVVGIGIYFGLQYLDNRAMQAQQQLGKAIDFFHAQVAADAPDDPYGKGPTPLFRSDAAKYVGASKEFSSIISRYGRSEAAIIARYYLGLAQIRLGQTKEAIHSLESVGNNSRDRTVEYLAKRASAMLKLNTGNHKGAQEILESMIKDPQCKLPREDLSIQLSRVLVVQGKRGEAIKVLREASAHPSGASELRSQVVAELNKLEKARTVGLENPK